MKIQIVADAFIVLSIALAGSFYFSFRKARDKGQKIWTPVSKRLLISLLLPLIAGVFFILVLLFQNQWQLIVPAMLIFYGLALISAGKFTYSEVFYLGLAELITGFASVFFPCLHSFSGFWVLESFISVMD